MDIILPILGLLILLLRGTRYLCWRNRVAYLWQYSEFAFISPQRGVQFSARSRSGSFIGAGLRVFFSLGSEAVAPMLTLFRRARNHRLIADDEFPPKGQAGAARAVGKLPAVAPSAHVLGVVAVWIRSLHEDERRRVEDDG